MHALVHEHVELGRFAWTEEVDRLSDGHVRIVGDEDLGGSRADSVEPEPPVRIRPDLVSLEPVLEDDSRARKRKPGRLVEHAPGEVARLVEHEVLPRLILDDVLLDAVALGLRFDLVDPARLHLELENAVSADDDLKRLLFEDRVVAQAEVPEPTDAHRPRLRSGRRFGKAPCPTRPRTERPAGCPRERSERFRASAPSSLSRRRSFGLVDSDRVRTRRRVRRLLIFGETEAHARRRRPMKRFRQRSTIRRRAEPLPGRRTGARSRVQASSVGASDTSVPRQVCRPGVVTGERI